MIWKHIGWREIYVKRLKMNWIIQAILKLRLSVKQERLNMQNKAVYLHRFIFMGLGSLDKIVKVKKKGINL